MTAPLFLGVDGGGTKTAFVVLSAAGEIAATHEASTSYHLRIGLEGLRALLEEGVNAVLRKAGLRAGELRFAFFGLPAYGEDSRIIAHLDDLPAGMIARGRYLCGNDMICGWAGSLSCADGINITAGTGSIGYGERRGKTARAGGWGEVFGDEGSAYWIAVRGLNAFSRMSDGRLPRGALHRTFLDAFELASDLDLSGTLLTDLALDRTRVAELSSLVARAAAAGDHRALQIFVEAAEELAQIVNALHVQLEFAPDETVSVSYSGGVFNSGELILAPLERALARLPGRFVVRRPRFSPVLGAALYAARTAGEPLASGALERLATRCGSDSCGDGKR